MNPLKIRKEVKSTLSLKELELEFFRLKKDTLEMIKELNNITKELTSFIDNYIPPKSE